MRRFFLFLVLGLSLDAWSYADPLSSTSKIFQSPPWLYASPGKGLVTLGWGPVAGAVAYNVYRSTQVDNLGEKIASVSTNSYVDQQMTDGTIYYYSVTAIFESRASRQVGGSSAESKIHISEQVSDPSVKTLLVVAMQNGTRMGSGTLTKQKNGWTGSIDVFKTGPMNFFAYGRSSSGGVVWNGNVPDFTVATDGNSLRVPMKKLATENSTTLPTLSLLPVAGGTFTLKADGPNMTANSFHMSENLITRTQFLAVMGMDPSGTSVSTGMNDPVQNVTWYMAIAFCNKLSLMDGLMPAYSVSTVVDWVSLDLSKIPTADDTNWDAVTVNASANGYRLPTEMQFMWAAMGGMNDRLFDDINGGVNTLGYAKGYAGSAEPHGGQTNLGNYAWYETNSPNTTQPVGTKKSNELGIYDLSGNVWELCWDWYGSYSAASQTDYTGAASGVLRVARGGSWSNDASYCSVGFRLSVIPSLQYGSLGFRVVRP